MSQYTKGEWSLFQHGITTQIMCGKYKVAEGIYNKANARLIAASPLMYEALKALIAHMTMAKSELGRPYLADVGRMADKALAKAEGK